MSALSDAAAALAPGAWVKVLGFVAGPLQGGLAEGNRLPYCNGSNWDALNHRVPMVVSDHEDNNGPQYCSYREDTNTVETIELLWSTNPQWGSHAYDMTTCNPYTGAVYRGRYGFTTIGRCVTPLTGGFVHALTWLGEPNITVALTWWDGPYTGPTGSLGVQGGLIAWTANFGGILTVFDGITDNICSSLSAPPFGAGIPGEGQYHELMEYSKVHNCAVAGGGNAYPRKLFRHNSNATSTLLTDPPINISVSPNVGGANLCVDPVSGNFLILGDLAFYQLNPLGTGTYTLLPTPPPPLDSRTVANNRGDMMSFPISTYGVVGYFVRQDDNTIEFWIYKHSPSVIPPESTKLAMTRR